jgi:hypothetical protein
MDTERLQGLVSTRDRSHRLQESGMATDYAARFANNGDYDLGEAVLARLAQLEQRDRK